MKKSGSFEMDERARELRKGGIRIRLQDQPFEILALMLERPGEIVTRDELRQRLWPAGTFVDCEHSLNAAVKRLRAELVDAVQTSLEKRGRDRPRVRGRLPARRQRSTRGQSRSNRGAVDRCANGSASLGGNIRSAPRGIALVAVRCGGAHRAVAGDRARA